MPFRPEYPSALSCAATAAHNCTQDGLPHPWHYGRALCRTIVVLTKPDLINPGAEPFAVPVLLNKELPLKHGWVMVKNRMQKEVADNVSLAEAHAARG